MAKTAVCFRFDSALDLYVRSYQSCRGCTSVPKAGQRPYCDGLIHSETWIAGDEYGPYPTGANVCDTCGDLEITEHTTVEAAEHFWTERDLKRMQVTEENRKRTDPSPKEIVQAWIDSVPERVVIGRLGYSEYMTDEITTEIPEWLTYRKTEFPNFRNFLPKGAAGDLDALFRSAGSIQRLAW